MGKKGEDSSLFGYFNLSLFLLQGFNSTRGFDADSCFISTNLAGQLGIVAGDLIAFSYDLTNLFGSWVWNNIVTNGLTPVDQQGGIYSNNNSYVKSHRRFYRLLKVQGVYSGGGGKHDAGDLGLIVSGLTIVSDVVNHTNPYINPLINSRLSAISWQEYASDIAWNLPPLRVDNYRSSDFITVGRNVASFMSNLLYVVSWFNIDVTLPVYDGVFSYRFFSVFLGLILNVIIVFIFLLSVLLVYSLLLVSVEARTFELGIMRMVGLSRSRLVGLVLTQGLAYAIPAIAIGLPLAQLLAWRITIVISNISLVALSPLLTPLAICLSIAAGLLLPLVSSILPIRAALSKNIWDSVDTRRSKTKAVEYKITRASTTIPSLTLIIIGIVLAALGFIIYYLVPYGLVTSNFYLVLNVFFLILLGMLFGLVVLASNLQPLLEWGYLWLFFFWEKRAVLSVTQKNFDAHRRRNAKTSIMFAISLAFIIFLSVTFTTQINTLIVQTNQERATIISLRVDRGNYLVSSPPASGLPVAALEGFLAQVPQYVLDHAWVTMPLPWQEQALIGTGIANLGKLSDNAQDIRGVTPNVFTSSFQGFSYINGGYDPLSGATSPPETVPYRLYGRSGSATAIVGSNRAAALGVTRTASGNQSDFLLRHTVQLRSSVRVSSISQSTAGDSSSQTSSYYKRMRVQTYMDLAPLFQFSQYPTGSSVDVLVSMPTFVSLMNSVPNATLVSMDDVLMEYLLLQTASKMSDSDFDALKRNLTSVVAGTGTPNVEILDTRGTTQSLDTATTLVNLFFLVVVVVALVICFFSLSSSMYTNIHEQKKEIGIMLAIGIPKAWLRRMYVWEGVCVVIAASTLGVAIGVLVSYTMTLQQQIFTQLPVPFTFPWVITLVVIGASLLFGFLASFGPLLRILRMSPVQILRSV